MDKNQILSCLTSFLNTTEDNIVKESDPMFQYLNGVKLYDAPLIKYGRADDPLFTGLKSSDIIGPHVLLPAEWLPGAKTVISVFLPVSEAVATDNQQQMDWPSPGWLYARIEGQAMIRSMTIQLVQLLQDCGFETLAPSLDSRFFTRENRPDEEPDVLSFTSNWSERHAAFICGTGTFGLSKGLITEKGMAGRFTSIITTLELAADSRPYTEVYEYCSRCGACIRNCPAGAISLVHGKDHKLCSNYLNITRTKYHPRYGCGKCQVKVPCERKPCKKSARLH